MMNHNFSLCEMFYYMSREQYEIYMQRRNELDELVEHKNCFDVLSHNPEEINKFNLLSNQSTTSAISTIIFQALAIEAYINLYGCKKLGNTTFNDHYDRISILDKIIIIPKIATGKDFPKSNHIYGQIKKLFKQRDKLVHYKSKTIDLQNCTQEDYNQYLYNSFDFIFEDIRDFVDIYPSFTKILAQMEGKQISLVDEQQVELFSEMANLITDTVQKVFGVKDI